MCGSRKEVHAADVEQAFEPVHTGEKRAVLVTAPFLRSNRGYTASKVRLT